MNTFDTPTIAVDHVISEGYRAKTPVVQKHGFDVDAMVRTLRKIDEEEDANKVMDSTATRITPPAQQDPRHRQT